MDSAKVEGICIEESDMQLLLDLAVKTQAPGAARVLRKLARKYRDSSPLFIKAAAEAVNGSVLRSSATATTLQEPIDVDSRLALLRREDPVILEAPPIYEPNLELAVNLLVAEHQEADALADKGLTPTRTVLMVGPPGVGKTLTARWIAKRLNLPLLVLDLASVMSSFLGKTGGNLRRALNYARSTPSVLLLDELDAIAKRRDDSAEVGELKRLVTVLLQEIDLWPEGSLLLAATNHSGLLDPAVWRRFEQVLDFPLPTRQALTIACTRLMEDSEITESEADLIGWLFEGVNMSYFENVVMRARRYAAVMGGSPVEELLRVAGTRVADLSPKDKGKAAARLQLETGWSQRAVQALTGVSRDTLRKYSSRLEEG